MLPETETRNDKQYSISIVDKENEDVITVDEVIAACKKIAIKKAPGPDGIPAAVAKKIGLGATIFWRDLFNACMNLGYWPVEWKTTRLVLLPKGKPTKLEKDKNIELKPSDFRPLCIASNIAKIFEQIIKGRLLKAITKDDFSPHQFGFRKGHSTIHAMDRVVQLWDQSKKEGRHCLLILLDVKNAFNSLRWDSIVDEMRRRDFPQKLINLIRSYLNDRWLEIGSNDTKEKIQVYGGVPQGSIIGPFMWNLVYDGFLKIKLRRDVFLVAFADDIGIIVIGKDLEKMKFIVNETIKDLHKWYESEELELAPHKSESLLLTGRKHIQGIQACIGENQIPVRRKAKYLGVIFEYNQVFKEHIKTATDKSSKYAMSLSLLMPNVKGAGSKARQLYYNVVNSVIMYGAPIWARALTYKLNIKTLRDAQRQPLSRICRAYRTVSTEVLCVITGKIPWDYIAKEAEKVFKKLKEIKEKSNKQTNEEVPTKEEKQKVKENERRETMIKWQLEWTSQTKGRWTYRVIPNIEVWYQDGPPPLEYHTVQVLTGHGCFATYLHKIGKENSENCWFCDDPKDDVMHTLFQCPRWGADREILLGHIYPETWEVNNLANLLKKKNTNYYIREFCKNILTEKEKWEKIYREKIRRENKSKKRRTQAETIDEIEIIQL